MFDNYKNRYITCGVQREVSQGLQIFMWRCIDELKELQEVDYLQVFEITSKGGGQNVEHRQEIPEYKHNYFIPCDEIEVITAKIFVIDDGEYSTMLLAEEY